MTTRPDVLDQLNATMSDVKLFYADLDDEDLLRPITESAVEGEEDWSAKDRLAHLAQVEGTFRGDTIAAVLATLAGHQGRHLLQVQGGLEAHRADGLR